MSLIENFKENLGTSYKECMTHKLINLMISKDYSMMSSNMVKKKDNNVDKSQITLETLLNLANEI